MMQMGLTRTLESYWPTSWHSSPRSSPTPSGSTEPMIENYQSFTRSFNSFNISLKVQKSPSLPTTSQSLLRFSKSLTNAFLVNSNTCILQDNSLPKSGTSQEVKMSWPTLYPGSKPFRTEQISELSLNRRIQTKNSRIIFRQGYFYS